MAKGITQFGRCKLCGENRALTFEHVPPSSAYNKNTRHKSIKMDDYSQIESIDSFNPKGKILQGGIGYYALCKKCNSFLGDNYVPAFKKFVQSGAEAIKFNPLQEVSFCSISQEPLKILKQIISMFIVINDELFVSNYPELKDFVRDVDTNILSERFNVYCYLKSAGQFRYCSLSVVYDPIIGVVICSEIAFPPFGFILTLDHKGFLKPVLNITTFKHFNILEKVNLSFNLIKLETHLPFPPLDYRSKASIDNKIKEDSFVTKSKKLN
jgi:hypothetical protein